jgi:hypothetical protein
MGLKKNPMNSQRDKRKIITYPAETLKTFKVFSYEWIDNLCFTIEPKECFDNPEEYINIVKELFLAEGWDGDGEIELMWIPPFMFEGERTEEYTRGVIVWHVKQLEDGISWILHPKNLFEKIKRRIKSFTQN